MPPAAQAFSSDLKDAFPVLNLDEQALPYNVLDFEGKFYIDRCLAMGLSTATNIFGNMADGAIAILEEQLATTSDAGLTISIGFRVLNGDGSYSVELNDIKTVLGKLDLTGHPIKTFDFADIFEWLGFIWCISLRTCFLKEKKWLKYMAVVAPLLNKSASINLKDLEKVIGKLFHVTSVLWSGRLRLQALIAFQGKSKIRTPGFPFTSATPSVRSFTGGTASSPLAPPVVLFELHTPTSTPQFSPTLVSVESASLSKTRASTGLFRMDGIQKNHAQYRLCRGTWRASSLAGNNR